MGTICPAQRKPPRLGSLSLGFLLGLLLLLGEYVAGPTVQFPIWYLLPIAVASWYHGIWWGLGWATVLPVLRIYLYFFITVWPPFWNMTDVGLYVGSQILVFAAFAWLITQSCGGTEQVSKRGRKLQGLLPVCSFCKKIRDEEGHWHSMERFITERSEAQFTHGFCPECEKRQYAELLQVLSLPAARF